MSKGNRSSVGEGKTPLAAAAGALDAELRRYAELAAEVHRVPLNSEKNLGRAARALSEAAAAQERIGGFVAALVEAITDARDDQQTTAERLFERAQEIQARVLILEALTRRFAHLGESTRAMNALMQEAAATANATSADGEPTAEAKASHSAELAARLAGVDARMGDAIEEAAQLVRDASEDAMDDIAQGADALRQKLLGARNKLKLLSRSFAPVGVA